MMNLPKLGLKPDKYIIYVYIQNFHTKLNLHYSNLHKIHVHYLHFVMLLFAYL